MRSIRKFLPPLVVLSLVVVILLVHHMLVMSYAYITSGDRFEFQGKVYECAEVPAQ